MSFAIPPVEHVPIGNSLHILRGIQHCGISEKRDLFRLHRPGSERFASQQKSRNVAKKKTIK